MERAFELISFDFDGVILHNTSNDDYLAHCRELGLVWDGENERQLWRFFHDYWGGSLYREDFAAHGEEHFWRIANQRFLEILGARGDQEAAIPRLITLLQAFDPTYFHESCLPTVLQGLRDEGYRVVMITNRNEEVRGMLAAWELDAYFETVITRTTAGQRKPHRAPFDYACQQFGIAPQRALHVGDNPHADVVGARNAGWHALLLDPEGLFPDWGVPQLPTLADLPAWFTAQQNGLTDGVSP